MVVGCVAVCACPQHIVPSRGKSLTPQPPRPPAPQRLPSLHNLLEVVTQMALHGLPWSTRSSTLWTTHPSLLRVGFPFPGTISRPRAGHCGAAGFPLSIRAQSTHRHTPLPYPQTLQAMIPPWLPFLLSYTCNTC